jgi:hypothetical protein
MITLLTGDHYSDVQPPQKVKIEVERDMRAISVASNGLTKSRSL